MVPGGPGRAWAGPGRSWAGPGGFFWKKPKVYFIWGPEVGTSRGHEPIIIPSCGAFFFFRIELIEIYPPVTSPEPYNGPETQLWPKNWPT